MRQLNSKLLVLLVISCGVATGFGELVKRSIKSSAEENSISDYGPHKPAQKPSSVNNGKNRFPTTYRPTTYRPTTYRPTTAKPSHVQLNAARNLTAAGDSNYRLVCYYPQWAVYRPGIAKITPDQIDPQLCTHIIYAFAKTDSDYKIASYDDWADVGLGGFKKIVGLKQQNPSLKVLISVGGWTFGSTTFSNLAQSSSNRAAFTASMLAFFQQWGFDGLDIDWEYPTEREGRAEDKRNFPTWLAELRAAFGSRYLLTISAGASSSVIDAAYDFPNIMKSIDFITMMAYDFHMATEPRVDHHSPLYSYDGEQTPTFNTDWAVKKYLSSGVPADKLVVGIPAYGHSWTLANAGQTAILSPGAGPAPPGPYLATAGTLGYMEICQNIKNHGWTKTSGLQRTYAYGQGQWVGYDAIEDGTKKANYVVQNNLGGIMVWDLSYEDFGNTCGDGKNPLVSAVRDVLSHGGGGPTTTTSSGTTTTGVTTTAGPVTTTTPGPHGLVCLKEGFWSDPRFSDCSRFVRCVAVNPGLPMTIYEFTCPAGTIFDMITKVCNFASQVTCTFDPSAVKVQ